MVCDNRSKKALTFCKVLFRCDVQQHRSYNRESVYTSQFHSDDHYTGSKILYYPAQGWPQRGSRKLYTKKKIISLYANEADRERVFKDFTKKEEP